MKTNKLIVVMVAIWALLGATSTNLYAYGPPQWQWQLQHSEATAASYAGIGSGNLQFTGGHPTSSQVTSSVGLANSYLATAQQTGTLANTQKALNANIKTIEAANPNAQTLYEGMVTPYGYLGTLADIQDFINTTTQAQRIAMMNSINSMGLYAYVLSQNAVILSLAKDMAGIRRGHARFLDADYRSSGGKLVLAMSGDDCGQWAAVDDALQIGAAFAFLFGQPEFGLTMAAVVAVSEAARHDNCQ